MSDAVTMMLLDDAANNAGAWIMFFAVLCGLVLTLFVAVLAFRLLVSFAVRQIRRRFAEGRI